jgi:hypothetical protein
MNKLIWSSARLLFCTAALSIYSTLALAALERTGDFALLDSSGEFHQFSRYQHKKALVIMSYAADCAAMPQALSAYQSLSSRYSADGIEFLLINSNGSARTELQNLPIDLPILEDSGQLVSASLGIQHAGDVRVLNPQRLTVLYEGPPLAEFEQTLSDLLERNIRDTVNVSNDGCAISYPARPLDRESAPDYASEVAPLIIEKCAECHRTGGVGPFPINSYLSLLGWSPMIREVLLTRRMPPTQIDPWIGHATNARHLTTQQLQTLVHWIDAGAPKGNSEIDPLALFDAASDAEGQTEWLLGEPDFIASTTNSVPATGLLDYVHVDIDLPFTEDKWVRAIQYLPDNEAVLHHLMAYVTAPDEDFWGAERSQENVKRRFLEGFSPGRESVTQYPEGTAVFIPKGHRLSLQYHYMSNGSAATDNTQVGLYFSEQPGLQELLTQTVSSTQFVLPPESAEHKMHAEYLFDQAVTVTGLRARMSYRGKAMKFSVERPDGRIEELLSIPAWNYGWQPHYVLGDPVQIPAGSKVHVHGAFDNSISNPANPDPGKEVRFGVSSTDELFTGYFTYYETR